MQTSTLLGAAALAVVAVMLFDERNPVANSPTPQPVAAPAATPTAAPLPPAIADGHYVLVVEGDRNGLGVTFASRKQAPWAGVPKALDSNWRLTLLDGRGLELADVPLDVRRFATDAGSVGKPARVQGCMVVDAKIGMLVNVPRFRDAQSYRFTRTDARGAVTVLGTVTGNRVRELAGDQR